MNPNCTTAMYWVFVVSFLACCFFFVDTTTYAFTIYQPTPKDVEISEELNERIDDLLIGQEEKAWEYHDKLLRMYNTRIARDGETWRMYILSNLIDHINSHYLSDIEKLDFISDDSVTKFVSRNVPYNDPWYVPKDLVRLYDSSTVLIAHGTSSAEWPFHLIRRDIYDATILLSQAYAKRFNERLKINSAFRSFEMQRDNYSEQCRLNKICAYPGFSEHQWGLTIDIWGMHGEKYLWMKKSAHKFWFHQSYQHGYEHDHYHKEPWHRRYVDESFATELHETWMTFTQWYEERFASKQ